MTEQETLFLAPGFRFHPTDEEIITEYLSPKVADQSFSAIAMGEVDLNKSEPWDLPSKAKMGEGIFYFFTQKERRYPTGMRTNRATDSGYWKATGKDKEIYRGNILVGMKKTLVFYKGRAPKGEKTNWVMHEFRLEGNNQPYHKDDWVVVRVFHKNETAKRMEQQQAATVMDEDESATNQLMTTNPGANAFHGHPSTSAFGGYLPYYQEEAAASNANNVNVAAPLLANPFIGQAKIEQFSNSMVSTSRETGLSSDWNAEISSGPPLFDLENIWNY